MYQEKEFSTMLASHNLSAPSSGLGACSTSSSLLPYILPVIAFIAISLTLVIASLTVPNAFA